MFYHLKERQVSGRDTVKVHSWVGPRVVEMRELGASLFVRDDRYVDHILLTVLAVVESSAEQRHAHDTEDQPEDETDQQNVKDRWYCLHQRVYYHLTHSHNRTLL